VSVVLEEFGDAACRARLPEGANGRAVLEALRALPGVRDAVVSERHALVVFDPAAPPEGVGAAIARALDAGPAATPTREHVIAVRYDGPDLGEAAALAGVSADELTAIHASAEYVVAAIGFLPGFAYLRGLDPRLVVPRRATPRPRVAPLSLGMAGPYTGVYPFASSGGWNLIGTAIGFTPFDARGGHAGARLALGDRVRFSNLRKPAGSP
jgi:UPF0271 protein